jgi:hypothetical protein
VHRHVFRLGRAVKEITSRLPKGRLDRSYLPRRQSASVSSVTASHPVIHREGTALMAVQMFTPVPGDGNFLTLILAALFFACQRS